MSIIKLNSTYKENDFGKTFTRNMWVLSVGAADDMVEVMAEDGISTDIVAMVILTNELTDQKFYHPYHFVGSLEHRYDERFGSFTHYINSRSKAEDFIQRIKDKGVINLKHWERL